MKNVLLFLFIALCSIQLSAQISYLHTDYAQIEDNFHLSKASIGLGGFDFEATGENYAWDYSLFSYDNQTDDIWIDPLDGGYKQKWCNAEGIPIWQPNVCTNEFLEYTNLAQNLLDTIKIGSLELVNLVNHYNVSSDVVSMKMYGGVLKILGVPFSMIFEYSDPEEIYQFPITYGQNYTTTGAVAIDLSSFFDDTLTVRYASNHVRNTTVEGWGQLTTPFDYFPEVLKMKTFVEVYDTVYFDESTFIVKDTLVYYSWFSKDYGIPVLTANGIKNGPNILISGVTYIDGFRCVAPIPLFSTNPLVIEYDTLAMNSIVKFNNWSTNADSTHWDFGDGNTTTQKNPTHTYNCPGWYNVRLDATNKLCDPDTTRFIVLPIFIQDATEFFTEIYNISICNGDSIFLQNAWQKTAGTYRDTLTSVVSGCDSIIKTILKINPSYFITKFATIYQGDSLFLQEQWQYDEGIYYDTLFTVNGCDSVIQTSLSYRSVKYVNHLATGNNDGTSWENAYTQLYNAINNSVSGDEIWVAEGTYYPQDQWGFNLKENTKILGGFSGSEILPSQRDIVNNKTILSGDVNKNTTHDNADAYYVVYCSNLNDIILDGFTIKDGYAYGGSQKQEGAGLRVNAGRATVINCTFTNNKAISTGGAVYLHNAAADIINCVFYDNEANIGGAVYKNNLGTVNITNSLFYNNTASNGAGGAGFGGVLGGNSYIYNCTFANNTSLSADADEINVLKGTLTIKNSIIWGKRAGHLYPTVGTQQPIVENSTVRYGFDGIDVFTFDPLFIDSLTDYRLSPCSPAINAAKTELLATDAYDIDGDGNSAEKIPFDLINSTRSYDNLPDLGAYEMPFALPYSTDTIAAALSLQEETILIGNPAVFEVSPTYDWLFYRIKNLDTDQFVSEKIKGNGGDLAIEVLDITESADFKLFISPGQCNPIEMPDFIHLIVDTADFFENEIYKTICQGETFEFAGEFLSESGTYYDTIPILPPIYQVDILHLTVNPLPTKAATPNGTSELCINPSNQDYSTTGATDATSYIWAISPENAGTISGTGTTATVDFDNAFTGTAQITVAGQNECGISETSDILTVTISICTGIFEQNIENKTIIYPNPSTGQFSIKISDNSIIYYEIINSLGQVIIKKQVDKNIEQIEIKQKGVYLLLFYSDKNIFTKHLIIN